MYIRCIDKTLLKIQSPFGREAQILSKISAYRWYRSHLGLIFSSSVFTRDILALQSALLSMLVYMFEAEKDVN